MTTPSQSQQFINLDEIREQFQSLSKAQKIFRMVVFFSQYPVFLPISCSGPAEECDNNCPKKQLKKISLIFDEKKPNEPNEPVSIPACQIKFGK